MANAKEYYVYTLSDPVTLQPFYVGKGKGSRMYEHEREAKTNPWHPKCKKIREIKEAGLKVVYLVVKEFKNEEAAYKHEERLIKKIGRKNLTNLTDGGRGAATCAYVAKEDTADKRKLEVIFFLLKKASDKCDCFFTYCGARIPLSDGFFDKMRGHVAKIAAKRGENFVMREAKKHKLFIEFVSKVENCNAAA